MELHSFVQHMVVRTCFTSTVIIGNLRFLLSVYTMERYLNTSECKQLLRSKQIFIKEGT